jgi:hypothetical protein
MDAQQSEHRYSAREVRAILRRVAELGQGRGATDATVAPTLSQLQVAASELGLDPTLVAQAAREVAGGHPRSLLERLLGGPWREDRSEVVDGALTEADWPLLLDELRVSTGCTGEPRSLGSGFGWANGVGETDSLHVTATPDAGRTRVRVTARWGGQGSVLLVMPPLFGLLLGGIASGLLMDSGRGVPVWVGLCLLFGPPLAALAAGCVAVRRLCRRRRRSVADVARVVQAWITQRYLPAEAPAPAIQAASVASETDMVEFASSGSADGTWR